MNSVVVSILFIVSIVVSIWISGKYNISLGIPAWICAWLLGVWGLGASFNTILSYWPTSIVFMTLSVCMMFSFPSQNGAVTKLADHILYKFRKMPGIIVFVIFLIGVILGALGSDSTTTTALLCGIAFPIASSLGLHPVPVIISICHSAAVGSQVSWGTQGLILRGTFELYFTEGLDTIAWKLFAAFSLTAIVTLVLATVLTRSLKVKVMDIHKPEPFDGKQKVTLAIIIVIILMVVVPSVLKGLVDAPFLTTLSNRLNIQTLAMVGTLLMTVLKLGDPKVALQKGVPWNTIMLITGMITLVKVAELGGMTDLLASWLSGSIPVALIGPVFVVLAGFLSFFTGATTSVFPMLTAVAIPLSATTGLSPVYLMGCIAAGARVTAVSPFSTGGSLIQGYCNIEEWTANNRLVKNELIAAFGGMIICALLALVRAFPG